MKTRIVYPQMWLDEKFAECSLSTKLLFCYLINNPQLGLSRYTHLSDRQMGFDTGLNTVQIKQAKEELSNLRWVFFYDGWVFHNHECAYMDYVRNDRVATAKEDEISKVPNEIVEYFNQICLNNVEIVLEQGSNLNPKSEIRNKKLKEGGVGETKEFKSLKDLTDTEFREIADKYQVPLAFVLSKFDDMSNWLEANGKRYKNHYAALSNWVKKDAVKLINETRKENKYADSKRAVNGTAQVEELKRRIERERAEEPGLGDGKMACSNWQG